MKCTNCGKNNASYHYEFSVNGKRTEMHLCPECAAKLQPEKEFAGETRALFRDFDRSMKSFFNDDDFFGGLLGDGFFGGAERLLGGFFPMVSVLPAFLLPGVTVRIPGGTAEEEAAAKKETAAVDPELARQREMNALREQMKAAAQAEDYEKAAELRDKLREMEK